MKAPLVDPGLEVWNHSTAKGTDLVILLAIAKHADPDGFAWPGHKRLAEMARVGEQSVKTAIGKLEAAGELAVLRGQGRGNKSLYRVLLGQPEGAGDLKVMLAWLKGRTEPFLAALSKRFKLAGLLDGEKGSSATPLPAWEKGMPDTPLPGEKGYSATEEKGYSATSSTGAYRNELPIGTTDPPPPASAAPEPEQPNAGLLLEEHIDALGFRPAMAGRLGATIKGFLNREHIEPDVVRSALALMRSRRINDPGKLGPVVDEIRQRNGNGNGRYVNDDRWKPATTPRRRYGEDYTPEQKAELDRLLEDEWAGRQVLGQHLPGRTS